MASFIESVKKKAKADRKTIVLPEGNDERTLQAAVTIIKEDLANLVILGDQEKIYEYAPELSKATVINPATSEQASSLGEELYELRKNKGMTVDEAQDLIHDVLYFGVMMVKTGAADGMVAGACHATGDVLRPALQILKTAPDTPLVSSFFVMDVPNCDLGKNGTFIFADCGLNVQTDAESLANIAISSAKSWKQLIDDCPRVALLSHSTYGSAKNDDANKVKEAAKIANEKAPDLSLDGEMQVDAALDAGVAKLKCSTSKVAGGANVLIFPDLDSGNIGYKLVQRLAKADAFGPITQGIAAPVNDLSRGCVAEDIVGVVAITCVQAQ